MTQLTVHAPRRLSVSSALAVPVALGAAFFPSYLPHHPLALGVLLALTWLALRALAHRVRRSRRLGNFDQLSERTRQLAVLAAGVTALAVTASSVAIQNAMRAAIGMPTLILTDAGVVLCAATGVVGSAWCVHRVWARRTRWWRPLAALGIVATLTSAAPPVQADAGGAASASQQVLLQQSPVDAVRTYANLDDAPDLAARARLAAKRLVGAGGLDRQHVVIVLPTGSGWVNPHLISGLERRFGRDVATVAMQYDDRPSWLAYLFGRSEAEMAATALFRAVDGVVRDLPAAARPQVHVVGESLGASAGQAIFRRGRSGNVCSAMWVGTPGGSGVGAPRETLIANDDDPIVHANASMLVVPNDDARPWLPLVSGVQAAADYLSALSVPPGSGHRYGPEQADALRTCSGRPATSTSSASKHSRMPGAQSH